MWKIVIGSGNVRKVFELNIDNWDVAFQSVKFWIGRYIPVETEIVKELTT